MAKQLEARSQMRPVRDGRYAFSIQLDRVSSVSSRATPEVMCSRTKETTTSLEGKQVDARSTADIRREQKQDGRVLPE